MSCNFVISDLRCCSTHLCFGWTTQECSYNGCAVLNSSVICMGRILVISFTTVEAIDDFLTKILINLYFSVFFLLVKSAIIAVVVFNSK